MKSWNPFYRMSIRLKFAFMIIGVSALFGAAALGFVDYLIQNAMTKEAVNRTLIMANDLSIKAADPVQFEDLNALQFVLGEAISQPEVAYRFIRDGRGRILSSTFEDNAVPEPLQNINILNAGAPFGAQPAVVTLKDSTIEVVDVASPIAGGALGVAHVGLNMTLVKSDFKRLLLSIRVAWIGLLALMVLLTFFLSAYIVAPVRDVVRVTEAVGRGDLSAKAQVETGDEVGQFAETLNRTIDRLQGLNQTESDRDRMQHRVMDLLKIVSAAAEGDMTVKAEVTADALGSVAEAFNHMIDSLTMMVAQASGAASEIQRSTGDILHAAERIRLDAEQRAGQIRSASEVVKDMSLTTKRMSESAEAATQSSAKAAQSAVKGAAAVSETIKGMQCIRATVQSAGKRIKGLGERSLEIGAIIEVIKEIATQTNLMALNAAIEAARAGEQGSNSAVVADEVRKLAERAARATKDITGLVKSIQVETNNAVTMMEESTREAEEGINLADEAGAALREIEQIVKQTATLMADVTLTATDQVKSAQSMMDAMDGISHLTRETAHGAKNAVDTISSLAELTKWLNDALGRFKIGTEMFAPPAADEKRLPALEDFPRIEEDVTTSDKEIKVGFID
jgi:methyl-accepting chemotaxis protein